MIKFNNFLKTAFILLALFIFTGNAFGQAATCDAVPREVLIDLFNQTDLPAVAAQYQLNPTPLGQVGTPPTYRMQFAQSNTQTACQVAEDMQDDARIRQAETNRNLYYVE